MRFLLDANSTIRNANDEEDTMPTNEEVESLAGKIVANFDGKKSQQDIQLLHKAHKELSEFTLSLREKYRGKFATEWGDLRFMDAMDQAEDASEYLI